MKLYWVTTKDHEEDWSTKAEPAHQVIYDALDLPHQPGRTVKTVM